MIQQTIQEVKFEDIILAKKQRQAQKTNKIRHFLQYLHMLDENKAFNKKNQAIKEYHQKFVFREDLWLTEIKRVLVEEKSWTTQAFDWAFMAIQDGFYLNAGQLIAQKLVEAYNAQKLRVNYVIAKLEMLIAQFDHCTKGGSVFFEALLEVYIKTNNIKKIRETYRREIAMGFDDYDVVYAKYIKWQESQRISESKEHKELLQKARNYWENIQIFNEQQLPALQKATQFIPNQQIKSDKRNIKRSLVHLENVNAARVDETKYVTLLDLFETNTQKLWYLRRMALQQTHQMVEKYLEVLELSQTEDDQIINAYKNALTWPNNQSTLQLYEPLYLSYLIRRINKHLSKPQDEEYNNSWGSKVEFFRNQISERISKERPSVELQKQLVTKYYYLWIEVETSLVRDIPTVQQIYQNLLEWGQNQRVYIDYANSMVRLGDIAKARWIFNKTCETYNYQEEIVIEYHKFIKIYGSLEEELKLKEKIVAHAKKKSQPQVHKVIELVHHQKQQLETKPPPKQQGQITTQTKQQNQLLLINSPIHLYPQNQQPEQQEHKSIEEKNFKRPLPTESVNEDQAEDNHHKKKKVHLDQQNTLFSSNVQKNWTEADIMLNIVFKQCVNEVRIVDKAKGKLCYIEFDSEQNAQKQIKANKSLLNLAFSRPPSKSDNTTLFLCNLPVNVNKSQIKELIPQSHREQVKDIRMKQKGDKVTAYVEFKDQSTRDEALSIIKTEKIKISERAIIALSCESDFRNKDKKYKTLFLKNLSFKCKQKDIQGFFQKKGLTSITQVFIPKDEKTNRPKGFAYIEFAQTQELQKALQLQKGDLHGRPFTITKSDRAITRHDGNKEQKKPEKEENPKPKTDNKRSNNFFSNIFS